MFELFGSSSENKEEIDQNVEEIKDMVEGKEPPRQGNVARTPQKPADGNQGSQATDTGPQAGPVQAKGRQPPQTGQPQNTGRSPQEPSDGQGRQTRQTQTKPDSTPDRPQQPKLEQDSMNTSGNDATSNPEPQKQQARENAGDDDLPPPPGQPRNTGQSTQKQSDDRGQQTTGEPAQIEPEPSQAEPERSDETDTRPSPDNIPEAPESKEINVPDIEKGPLFIRVKKFKESKKRIHEMQDLTEDVETDMGGLKNTLEEDKDVRKDLKSRLKRLQDSMKSIHTILSP